MTSKINLNQLIQLQSNARQAKLFLRAIDHHLRMQILKLLEANGKMTVTDLLIQLRIEQTVASQHLAIMRRAGILKTDRDGKWIRYSIDDTYVLEMAHKVERLSSELPTVTVRPHLAKAA